MAIYICVLRAPAVAQHNGERSGEPKRNYRDQSRKERRAEIGARATVEIELSDHRPCRTRRVIWHRVRIVHNPPNSSIPDLIRDEAESRRRRWEPQGPTSPYPPPIMTIFLSPRSAAT